MRRLLAVAFALSLWPAVSDAADQVQLYAAGSLRTAFDTIAASYEKSTGVRVIAKYGASGLLRDELAGGAHADLFASAASTAPS